MQHSTGRSIGQLVPGDSTMNGRKRSTPERLSRTQAPMAQGPPHYERLCEKIVQQVMNVVS